ncbi:MAG: imidazole glycerol phosphate synthase subunit HisH [Bulleidia sp.]
MIAIIDYGVGNLFSLKSSLASIGAEAAVSRDPAVIHEADAVILPGVGAFGDAADKLAETGMKQVVLNEAKAGKPLLGICLGMQLLFDSSTEFGMHEGLGLISGQVDAIEPKLTRKLDIPHIGWNQLHFVKESPLFAGIPEGTYVYFVHSYAAFHCEKHLVAETEYEIPLTAAVADGNVYGTQFHPEKSGPMGLAILKNFCRIAGENL